jgi:hypothetical protein
MDNEDAVVYRFRVTVQLGELRMAKVKQECLIIVSWAKSKKEKQPPGQVHETQPAPFAQGSARVGQQLVFETNFLFSPSTKTFRKDKVELIVHIRTPSSSKVAGRVEFQPGDVLRAEGRTLEENAALLDCPVEATLQTRVKLDFIKQVTQEEVSQSSLASAFKKKKNGVEVPAKALPEDSESRALLLERELQARAKENEGLRRELARVQGQLAERDNQQEKEVGAHLLALEAENRGLRDQARDLQQQVASLQAKLSETQELELDLKEADKEIDDLELEKKELEKKLVLLSNRVGTIFNAVADLGGTKLLDKVMLAVGVK